MKDCRWDRDSSAPDQAGRIAPVDPADLELRNATYRRFVELGRAPTATEVAATVGVAEDEVRAAWSRLHDGHALVVGDDGDLRMVNPFAAGTTDFRVEAGGRSWYANCAWDAFGIGAALHVDSEFETHCPDCGEVLHVRIRDGRPDDATLVFHVLVPARQWWSDIGYT
jgi:predicted RNA-binding Zn-ribbon protein involved in translation (DUF1610 family)